MEQERAPWETKDLFTEREKYKDSAWSTFYFKSVKHVLKEDYNEQGGPMFPKEVTKTCMLYCYKTNLTGKVWQKPM